ncbi:hypothetical protein DPMN_040263 [Dreissena polymorpha]|uniref:Uncharacterized protein n=1 Tax=Dreissena polymorpha TaxID=45954 RepID=A0A9D4HWP9_DREPO|nr:hypothetical protein DPMN_040263 [Dreissena polymorpha]
MVPLSPFKNCDFDRSDAQYEQSHQLRHQIQSLQVPRSLHRTLHADTESMTFEHKCIRRLHRISYMEHKTNEYVRNMTATRTCWLTRAPTGNRQTTKVGLVWTRRQTRLSVQDCSPGHTREAVRRKAGWTMLKSGHPFPVMNYFQKHTTDLNGVPNFYKK